ncbi:MAG: hypothetical protein KatS3mg002_1374 [Candidatus Woesearchaeota archaeon]|nr:MAG: hypothetical protein KatS3mg002_1374 [Candidatus Woesearchaeota archaeon]
MTIQQLHYELELEVNKIDSNDRIDLLPAEKDAYLNRAIWIWFKNRYGSEKPKRGFETDQLRISNLASLHIKSPELQPPLTPTLLSNGIYEVKLNNLDYNYFVLTRARADIIKDNCTETQVQVKLVETDDMNEMRFLKPSFKWKRINARFGRSSDKSETQSLYLDTGNDFIISNVYIDYLKQPNIVFIGGYDRTAIGLGNSQTPVQCDIDSSFHSEIVSIARQEVERDLLNQLPQLTINKNQLESIN